MKPHFPAPKIACTRDRAIPHRRLARDHRLTIRDHRLITRDYLLRIVTGIGEPNRKSEIGNRKSKMNKWPSPAGRSEIPKSPIGDPQFRPSLSASLGERAGVRCRFRILFLPHPPSPQNRRNVTALKTQKAPRPAAIRGSLRLGIVVKHCCLTFFGFSIVWDLAWLGVVFRGTTRLSHCVEVRYTIKLRNGNAPEPRF
jgi:hypothetical protein